MLLSVLSTPYILKIASLLLFYFGLFSFWFVIIQKNQKTKPIQINCAIWIRWNLIVVG